MFKRTWTLLAVLVLILSSFAGCTDSGKTPSDGTTNSDDIFEPTSKKIRVAWIQQYWESEEDLDYLFDGFRSMYPEYEVERVLDIGETAQLLAEVLSGNAPDLFFGGDPNWATYVTGCYQRLFRPLDDYLARDTVYNTTTVDENLLNSTKFYPDGKHYAIPYALSAYYLAYNRKLFEAANLDPGSPPKTWSQWLDYNNKLHKTNTAGVTQSIGIRGDGPFGYIISPLRKQDLFTEDGLHSRYNEPWVVSDSVYAGEFMKVYNSKLPSDITFDILEGNVGMDENTNLFDLSKLTTSGIDFDISLLPRPDDYNEDVVPALLWMYLAIPTGAKNPNGGWLFAKYACTDGTLKSMEKDALENPKNYTPKYAIHSPTREKANQLYSGKADAKTQAIIEKRDELIGKINYYVPYPPIQNKKATIQDRWVEKYNNKEVTLAAMYEGVHNEMEQEFKNWRDEMTIQGWNFPDGEKPYYKKK